MSGTGVGAATIGSCTSGGVNPLSGSDERLNARERRLDSLFDRYTPYLGVVVGTALTPFAVPSTPGFWLVTGSLVLLSTGWTFVFASRRPARASDPRLGPVYVGGLLVLMAALVHLSPFYGFQAFAGYSHSFLYLRGRWRWTGVAATAVLAAYSQLGGGLIPAFTPAVISGWVAVALVNGAVAGGLTYFGALSAQQSQRRQEIIVELNEANRRLTETLEENAGLHARLLVQAREAGVLDERARLAREIHDTIAQGLTGIVTQLEAAGTADDDPEVRRRHMDTASALARESLSEARRSVDALAPGQLAETQLPDAIAEMGKTWAETNGVELVVETTGDPRPLLPELEVVLFRVAQEALANVGKHAEAGRAGLPLSYMDDVVVLDVRDDGRGFTPGSGRPDAGSGFGIAGMEQRVRRVAGTLAVESSPGEGAAVSATVPAIPAEVRA